MRDITTTRLNPETITNHNHYDLRAQVLPGIGANLISFTVDGTELIHWDAQGFLSDESFTGGFSMFPTPCRLENGAYEFEGRKITQNKRGERILIHGLVRDEIMEACNEGHRVTSWIEITPDHPVYEGFPFICRFSVTHELQNNSLTVTFKLDNKDTRNIPFGYGIHPFWRLHGNRDLTTVRIPCDYVLDLENLVPTGGYTSVAGTELDLRQGKGLKDLYIDNAFWKRKPGDKAELTLKAIGKSITFEASDNFQHMIVYAPEDQPFVCVENLTTCPNAPNLVSAGKDEITNMLVAAPGTSVGGWIKYTIRGL